MALAEERLRSIIESLLLISPDPVPIARLVEVILIEDPQTEEEVIKTAVAELVERYGDPDRPICRGFRISEVGGALQLRTVAENAPYVRRFLAAKPQRLTKAALETLSIIAYRQPVTKPEVEAIRGVDVGAAIKGLLERDFIKILGKKDEVGRPMIYGTTPYFLEFFGMRSLAELPTLREYNELDEEHQAEVDELDKKQHISELAQAASFLVERQEDPDLDALEAAVADADRIRKETSEVLDPGGSAEDLDDSEAPSAEAQAEPPAEPNAPDEARE